MIKYIIKDMTATLRYLPYGLVAGIVVGLMLSVLNNRRIKTQKRPFSVIAITGLFMYGVIILCITFLSRESGSTGGLDLKLLSTWGINDRNNAYLIENILLFVPYGFLCTWVYPRLRNVFSCTMLGLVTSMGVELLQLITGRGHFQIDDILTNTLGAMLGYILFRCIYRKK